MKTKKDRMARLVACFVAGGLSLSLLAQLGVMPVFAQDGELMTKSDAPDAFGEAITQSDLLEGRLDDGALDELAEALADDAAEADVPGSRDETDDELLDKTLKALADDGAERDEEPLLTADADSWTSADGKWEGVTNDGQVILTQYKGSGGAVTIPESIELAGGGSVSVTTIGDTAFISDTTITSITLPSSIKRIDSQAFNGCKALASVDFNNATSLTYIGDCAFMGCTSLAKLELPLYLHEMGEEAFRGCTSLTSVVYNGEALTEIPHACFMGCTALSKFMVPATVKILQAEAFRDCTGLTQVGFNAVPSLRVIGPAAFKGCSALTTLGGVPKSVTTIKTGAFEDCSSLTFFGFDNPDEGKLSSIESRAFANCSSLKEIDLAFADGQNSSVGENAFLGCSAVEKIGFRHFPQSNITASNAFSGLTGLKYGILFDEAMGSNTFGLPLHAIYIGCQTVGSGADATLSITIIMLDRNKGRDTQAGSLDLVIPATFLDYEFSSIAKNAMGQHPGEGWIANGLNSLSFEEGCKISSIGEYAFAGCEYLKSITIPSCVTNIGNYAFSRNTRLDKVNFQTTGYKEIREGTFSNCGALITIAIPEGVTKIDECAFENCKTLTNVSFPDTLEEIDSDVFKGSTKVSAFRMPDSDQEITLGTPYFWQYHNLADVKFYVTAGSWSDWWITGKGLIENIRYRPVPLDEAHVEFELDPDSTYTYNGLPQTPKLKTFRRWKHDLLKPTLVDPTAKIDYEIDWANSNCTNATTAGNKAYVTIVAKDYGQHLTKFSGSLQVEFEIGKADITDKLEAVFDPSNCFYDYSAWKPGFTLTYPGLKDGEDYVLTDGDYTLPKNGAYQNNTDAGEATLTVNGAGNFKGSCVLIFTIKKRNLELEATYEALPDQVYTGEQITIDPNILDVSVPTRDGEDLPLGVGFGDFTIDHYENNTDVTTEGNPAYVVIKGCDVNVAGTLKIPFNIVPASMDDVTLKDVPDQEYNGSPIEPSLEMTLGERTLVFGTDYTVSWSNNVELGTAKGKVTGVHPRFEGSIDVEFQIVPRKVTVTAGGKTKTYGDSDPKLTATVDRELAGEPVRYTLSRVTGQDVGKYDITVNVAQGQNHYDITAKGATFEIKPADLSKATMSELEDVTYDGSAWEPEPTVTWRGRTLVKGSDYELSYSNNTDASTATAKAVVTATGIGNFAGSSLSGSFEIAPLNINVCDVAMPYQIHSGLELKPLPKSVTTPGRDNTTLVLDEDTDYRVTSWRENVGVGAGYATIEGVGNFTGTREDAFNIINDGNLSQGYIDPVADQTYTGGYIEPELRVYLTGVDVSTDTWLRRDVDYVATFDDNEDVGTAKVKVTGINPFYGSQTTTFEIKPASIADAVVATPDVTYDGTAKEPKPTVTWHEMPLTEGKDYEIEGYVNNVHAGMATVTVRGMGNFDDETTASGTFEVKERGLTVTAGSASREYDGTPLTCDTFFSSGLADGDSIVSVVLTGSQTGRGVSDNVASTAVIENAAGDDVTKDYEIAYEKGRLEVLPYSKEVIVSVEGHTDSVTYDGNVHSVAGYDLWSDTELYKVAGVAFSGEASLSKTDADYYLMGLSPDEFSNTDTNFSNVTFDVTDGGLVIGKRQVTLTSASADKVYDGLPLTAGNVAASGEGWAPEHDGVVEGAVISVTGSQTIVGSSENEFTYELKNGTKADNYEVTTVFGMLEVTDRPVSDLFAIELVPSSGDAIYDGIVHELSGFEALQFDVTTTGGKTFPVTVEGLTASAAGTDAGSYPVTIGGTAIVRDVDGNDVTSQFEVSTTEGTLTIGKRSVTLTSASATKTYDGTPLTANDVTAANDGWAKGDGATYNVTGSQTIVGSSENEFTYALDEGTKAANYDVETAFGTLEVTDRQEGELFALEVVSVSGEATYDGAAHELSGFETLEFDVATTDDATFPVTVEGLAATATGTDVGSYPVAISGSSVVRDGEGNDVTAQFEVSTTEGVLTVIPAGLDDEERFSVAPLANEAYDGDPHEPVPVVTDTVTGAVLVLDQDFTLAYANNVEVGTATVTVTGKGNYAGAIDVTFQIVEATAEYVLLSAPSGPVAADGKTSPEFVFTRKGDDEGTFDHFVGVEVDGKRLEQKSFKARPGSVVISIEPSFVKTFTKGEHTLRAIFDDGLGKASFTVKASNDGPTPNPKPTPNPTPSPKPAPLAQTGDSSLQLPLVLATIGVLLLVAGLLRRARSEHR